MLPLRPREVVPACPGGMDLDLDVELESSSFKSSGKAGKSLSVSAMGCGSSCMSEIIVSCDTVDRKDLDDL